MVKLYLIVYVAGEIFAAVAMPPGMTQETCQGFAPVAMVTAVGPLTRAMGADLRDATVVCEFKTQARTR